VDFAIAASDLKLEPEADGTHHATVEVRLVAYDREGKPVNLVATKGDVLLQPGEFAAVQKSGFPIQRASMSPKNMYTCAPASMIFARTRSAPGVPLPI
jgi:hypothetical protein